MTFGTLDPDVRAHERESRAAMVEADMPKLHVESMTSFAVSTELILVNVLVTGDALGVIQEVRLGLLPRR